MIDKPGSFMDNGLQIFLRIVGVRSTEQSVRHLLTLISFELETRQT